MTESKPVRLTSPANAWALGAQLIALLIPVLSVVEIYQPIALEAISIPLADTWQWLLFVGASISLLASLLMRGALGSGNRMRAVLRLEGVATAIVSLCFGLLWAALVREYGFGANPLTQLLVGGLGLVALGRVGQILWDLWRYRRALNAGQTARVEAIAQPKGT
ncbi:hypothetical protein [Microbacterium oleivorans]|uniref:Uncharacterized protein n=1 Tax=Microbacterium oleivorans TaxID=273677 RepID=A0A7D5JCG4_9MICO|nr:hypothetical protein [Microbacterium oleivorans]QLD10880.1 hypothetical protein HW566_03230 [Microbacterium oleivorans]